MFIDKELVKIGKAGGSNGFASRAVTYAQKKVTCATTKAFLAKMEDDTVVEIFAIRSPKAEMTIPCQLTGKSYPVLIETHGECEAYHTHQHLSTGGTLRYCTQLGRG